MYGFVLQDWVSLKVSPATATPLIQNESDWLALSSFQDIAFWIDVRTVTVSTGTLTLELQTAPTKDDILFTTITGCSIAALAAASPVNPPLKCLLASNPAVPLSTWVRWSIRPTVSATWDTTFRILASVNRVAA